MIGIDFKQPSTWRGILGLTGLIGWSLSPELRDQIALVIAALLCLIEMLRNEYRAKDVTAQGSHETSGPHRPAAPVQPVQQLRPTAGLPTRDEAAQPDHGFNDR